MAAAKEASIDVAMVAFLSDLDFFRIKRITKKTRVSGFTLLHTCFDKSLAKHCCTQRLATGQRQAANVWNGIDGRFIQAPSKFHLTFTYFFHELFPRWISERKTKELGSFPSGMPSY